MSIRFVTIDNGVYSKYLGTCGLPVTILEPSNIPIARRYNSIIEQSMENFIVFIHADVTCRGLLEAIRKTIVLYPNFGALGAVGVRDKIIWAISKRSFEVIALDSCLLVVNKKNNIYFDDLLFDSFHGFVEDFSMQAYSKGLQVRTILIDGYEAPPSFTPPKGSFFAHHSNMVNKFGGAWGEFGKYKDKLKSKWYFCQTTSDY